MDQTKFKLIIAEDDPWIRDGLKQMVRWDRLGFEWGGEASNGIEALELCKQVRPDAAIVDISMPVMSGLDFIKQAKSEFPNLKIIIMTCHDDFQYAKQAISFGCEDYLLKNTSDIAKIEDVLGNLYSAIKKEKKNRVSQKILQALDSHSDHHLKDKWFAYLMDESLGEEYILLLPFAGRVQSECLLPLRIYFNEMDDNGLQIIKSRLIGRLADEENGELFLHEGYLYMFFPFHPNPSYSYQIQTAMEKGKWAKTIIKEATGSSFVLYMLEPFQGLEGFTLLKGKFSQLAKQSFYTSAKSIVPWFIPQKYENAGSTMSEWKDMMNRGIQDQCMDKVMNQFESKHLEPEFIKQCMLDVLEIKEPLTNEMRRMKDRLRFAATWFEAVEVFIAMLDLKEQGQGVKMRQELTSALEYIKCHYQEGTLSLNEIAEHVGLTPNYFGSLFKKESGITVVEHMNRLRIDKAKELARHDYLLKSYDVAEQVGIHDPQYFGRLFKKLVGVSFKKYQLMHD